jgi:hypothetical protein
LAAIHSAHTYFGVRAASPPARRRCHMTRSLPDPKRKHPLLLLVDRPGLPRFDRIHHKPEEAGGSMAR